MFFFLAVLILVLRGILSFISGTNVAQSFHRALIAGTDWEN